MVCICESKNFWWKYTYFLKVGIFLGDLGMDTQLFPGANDSHSRSVERDRDVPIAISSLSPSTPSFPPPIGRNFKIQKPPAFDIVYIPT